jgi:diadenosine tetraphosphatase ApaH/serine/threonine PP2A family protein phosphatase
MVYAQTDDGVRGSSGTPGPPAPIPNGRLMLNPGSVGQPRDGEPTSAYLVLDLDAGTLQFRRTAYDIERTQALMREASLPRWLVERLSLGR